MRAIEQFFLQSLSVYTADALQRVSLWKEIEKEYSKKGRYYHNLTHLDALVAELVPYKEKFQDWHAVVFAITYHDVVYNTLKSDNEERSADLASKRLSEVSCSKESQATCDRLIRATKRHERADYETNLFTDADLSILAAVGDQYLVYAYNIRREYSMYPDVLYNAGRKKALKHFLDMGRIYKTDEFADRYEVRARLNIAQELEKL